MPHNVKFVLSYFVLSGMITYDLSGNMQNAQNQWAAPRRAVYQQGYFTGKSAVRVAHENITEDEVSHTLNATNSCHMYC